MEESPPSSRPSFPQTLTERLLGAQHYSKHYMLHNQVSSALVEPRVQHRGRK